MHIVCLDLEGVLVPEIWIEFAQRSQIDALKLTTRDIADYDQLMQHRLRILDEHQLKLTDIQRVIAEMSPLEGAKDFLDRLRQQFQVVILSDTFYEFAQPLMRQLGWPTLFCHKLEVDANDAVTGYRLRQQNPKQHAVQALQGLNFKIVAAGDSYNDIPMLLHADAGILFSPPDNVRAEYAQLPAVYSYQELEELIITSTASW
ncbi:MAG: bifunctional phosphoserine phosphatase/homoserine phosphotransferase ThrH [Candidatus Competibacteraceae bacterium]|nr:bifunctional phosphoserine phosphatase/homoserine phosphotransferase ThrH [Candidatus Competibacteraceae bacterium]MCB1804469.1 bifunctional phosphoserine phosphatase/homoserine phosphotransferase ThrH [Candidatus Competibacteraceae bacterium]MCB1814907.1 bifunctional phosphoserine phosphatase/homoserine phosphotransferase ThrH [Candidatus Competibacteraceae bacterium]